MSYKSEKILIEEEMNVGQLESFEEASPLEPPELKQIINSNRHKKVSKQCMCIIISTFVSEKY